MLLILRNVVVMTRNKWSTRWKESERENEIERDTKMAERERAKERDSFMVPSLFGVRLSSNPLTFSVLRLKSTCDSCLVVRLVRRRNGLVRGNGGEASEGRSTVGGETTDGVETTRRAEVQVTRMVTTSGLGSL